MLRIRQQTKNAPEVAQRAYAKPFNKEIRRCTLFRNGDKVYLDRSVVWKKTTAECAFEDPTRKLALKKEVPYRVTNAYGHAVTIDANRLHCMIFIKKVALSSVGHRIIEAAVPVRIFTENDKNTQIRHQSYTDDKELLKEYAVDKVVANQQKKSEAPIQSTLVWIHPSKTTVANQRTTLPTTSPLVILSAKGARKEQWDKTFSFQKTMDLREVRPCSVRQWVMLSQGLYYHKDYEPHRGTTALSSTQDFP